MRTIFDKMRTMFDWEQFYGTLNFFEKQETFLNSQTYFEIKRKKDMLQREPQYPQWKSQCDKKWKNFEFNGYSVMSL